MTKYGLGYILIDFLHKSIWSPCLWIFTLEIHTMVYAYKYACVYYICVNITHYDCPMSGISQTWFIFQNLSSDPELRRSLHGSMLPLIFGLPFAPGTNPAPDTDPQEQVSGLLFARFERSALSSMWNNVLILKSFFGFVSHLVIILNLVWIMRVDFMQCTSFNY
jgi:hypothetical protein